MKKTKKEFKLNKRVLTGEVVSNVMANTVVVKVTTKKIHPIYKKVIKNWRKYKADTAGKTVAIGDSVTIQESKKLSHDKRWIVIDNK